MKVKLPMKVCSTKGCTILHCRELYPLIVHVGLDHSVLLNELAKGVDILLILPIYFHNFLLGLQALALKMAQLRMNHCDTTCELESCTFRSASMCMAVGCSSRHPRISAHPRLAHTVYSERALVRTWMRRLWRVLAVSWTNLAPLNCIPQQLHSVCENI